MIIKTRLGIGSTDDQNKPIFLIKENTIKTISTGENHSMLLKVYNLFLFSILILNIKNSFLKGRWKFISVGVK